MTFSLKRHIRNPHASSSLGKRTANASSIDCGSSSDESLSIVRTPVTIHLMSDSSSNRDDSSAGSSDDSVQIPVNPTRTSACRVDSTVSMKRRMKRQRRIIASSSDSSIESFSSNDNFAKTPKLRDQQLTSRKRKSPILLSKTDSTELVAKDENASTANPESPTSLAEKKQSSLNQTFLCDNSSSDGSLLETHSSSRPSRTSKTQQGPLQSCRESRSNRAADSSPKPGTSNTANVDENTRTNDSDHEIEESLFGISKQPRKVDGLESDASSVDTIELANRIKTRYCTQSKQDEDVRSTTFDSSAHHQEERETTTNDFTLPDYLSSSSSSPSHHQNCDDEGDDDDDHDDDKPASDATGEALSNAPSAARSTFSPTNTVRSLNLAKQIHSAKSPLEVGWTNSSTFEAQVPHIEIAPTTAPLDTSAAPEFQSEIGDTVDKIVGSPVSEGTTRQPFKAATERQLQIERDQSQTVGDAKGVMKNTNDAGNKHKTAAYIVGPNLQRDLPSSTIESPLKCLLSNKENNEVEDHCKQALRQEEVLRLELNTVNSRSYPMSSLSQVELSKLEDQAFFDGATGDSPKRRPMDLGQIESREGRFCDHNGTKGLTRTTIHQGTRSTKKSPAFNLRSREFWNATQDTVVEVSGTTACQLNTNEPAREEFDFIDSYSDDERLGSGRPRRVTDILPISTPKENARTSQRDSIHFASAYAVPPTISSDPPRQWVAKPQKRRLLREAARNPFHAGSIARNRPVHLPPPPQESIVQASSNVWIRQSNISNSFQSATLRNDLAGGSGVGAGSYVLRQEECHNEGQQSESSAFASSKATRKRQTGTKSRKKGWKGKRGSYGKRGNRGRAKSTGSSNRGRSRNSGSSNSQAPFSKAPQSRDDPLLRNVGGAEITF